MRLGAYEPLLAVAAGGMATVYIARQHGAAGFERLVAIKRVHPHLLGNREFFDMFRDEARISSLIRHPNVVSASDVVESNGELFLVMDYVESVSLARIVRETPAFPPPIASRVIADVLAGLHAAHEAVDMRGQPLGVIHRDVSPQNILVAVDGTSRVIDFGIAKAAARLAETSGGALRGKLRYMSPEQVKQQQLDRRADVFAAGIVLHEILTGRRLFEGTDEGDIVLGILLGDAPPPSSVTSAVTPALDAVVAKALAQQRDERYATALEMHDEVLKACRPAPHAEVARFLHGAAVDELTQRRDALRGALDGVVEMGSGSLAAASITGRREDATTSVSTATERAAPPRARSLGVAAGVALVVLVAAAAVVLVRQKSAPPRAPTPQAAAADPPLVSVAPPSLPPSSSTSPMSAQADPAASTSVPLRKTPPPPPKARPTGDLHRNPYAK